MWAWGKILSWTWWPTRFLFYSICTIRLYSFITSDRQTSVLQAEHRQVPGNAFDVMVNSVSCSRAAQERNLNSLRATESAAPHKRKSRLSVNEAEHGASDIITRSQNTLLSASKSLHTRSPQVTRTCTDSPQSAHVWVMEGCKTTWRVTLNGNYEMLPLSSRASVTDQGPVKAFNDWMSSHQEGVNWTFFSFFNLLILAQRSQLVWASPNG